MIRHLRLQIFYSISLLMILGCSTTQKIAINIVEPAPVSLSGNIKRIGIVNMYLSDHNEPLKTGMDLLVARDDDYLQEKGTDAALEGLFKNLNQDPRFDTIVRLHTNSLNIQNGRGHLDEATWSAIRNLCEDNELDAVFALAFYHADTEITLKKSKVHQRDLMRMDVAKKGHELTLETLIENGWRIFDPYQMAVLDEFVFKEQLTAKGNGSTPLVAYEAIGSRQDSLVKKSWDSGVAYGSRLRPYERTIYRPYHSSGTERFVNAMTRIEDKDWEGAISMWKQELSNDKIKIRAMACHNLAVVYEVLDNLEAALSWAIKSDEYQSNKNSRLYIDILKQRMSQNQMVDQQLLLLGR